MGDDGKTVEREHDVQKSKKFCYMKELRYQPWYMARKHGC